VLRGVSEGFGYVPLAPLFAPPGLRALVLLPLLLVLLVWLVLLLLLLVVVLLLPLLLLPLLHLVVVVLVLVVVLLLLLLPLLRLPLLPGLILHPLPPARHRPHPRCPRPGYAGRLFREYMRVVASACVSVDLCSGLRRRSCPRLRPLRPRPPPRRRRRRRRC
jgi:hypothetical protein